ncbi:MAG: hypothetical protein WBX14_08485 [Candidatus Udaeobacter sp.]
MDVGRLLAIYRSWTLDVFFFWESEGCLVALAVFKTVVVSLGGTG